MGFLSPWFLAGLAGLGLPVFVHLLRRHTTTPRPFSSLMFFERGTQSSTRHRRLRYLLLFALRFALLLLIVLAFASPFLRSSGAAGTNRLLVLAIDHSFSMRAGATARAAGLADPSRLGAAKRAAIDLLASKPASQRAQIVALGSEFEVLTQPVENQGTLRSSVEGIEASDSHASLGELQRGIRAIAENSHTPVELHLFSDMQKSGMPANLADVLLPPNVSLVLHSAGGEISQATVPNWTVESVEAPALLSDPKDPRRSHVRAVIAGYGTPAATRSVSLLVNGKPIASRKLDIPAGGRATVEFQPLDIPDGASRCEVRLDAADGFPADDASVFSVKRSDPERVLFVHATGDARSPLYFGAALEASAQSTFLLQSIDADRTGDVDPSRYAFVVLSDVPALPSIFENALAQYVRHGGGVLVAAGTAAARHGALPLLPEKIQNTHFYTREGGFATVAQTDLTHPVLSSNAGAADPGTPQAAATAGGKDLTGWPDVKIYYAAVVDPAGSRVLARLSDGTPFLLDKALGEGRVLLLASGLDNLTNDLPLHGEWVSFVDRAAQYLAGGERGGGARTVDSFVQLRRGPAEGQKEGAGVEVIAPDGQRPLSLGEARSAASLRVRQAGFYQVRFADGRDALIAVNPDRRESDLQPIPREMLAMWSGNSAPGAPAAAAADLPGEKSGQVSVWWYVMLLALALAVAQSILASRYLGTDREEA